MMDTELAKNEKQKTTPVIGAKSRKPVSLRTGPKPSVTKEDLQIIEAALEAKNEWADAGTNFDHVSDELLVDYYIYRLKACESRYTYFLRLAKERGLSHYL